MLTKYVWKRKDSERSTTGKPFRFERETVLRHKDNPKETPKGEEKPGKRNENIGSLGKHIDQTGQFESPLKSKGKDKYKNLVFAIAIVLFAIGLCFVLGFFLR